MVNYTHPPGPTLLSRALAGTLLSVDSPDFYKQNHARFGDSLSFLTPNGFRQFQFNHPDLIHDVLVRDAPHHLRGVVLRRARGILGDGLLTSEDPLHLRQRRLAAPAFHRDRIALYGAEIVRLTREMLAGWTPGPQVVPGGRRGASAPRNNRQEQRSFSPGLSPTSGETVLLDTHAEMVRLTLRITSRCLLGADVLPSVQTFVDSMSTFNDYLPFALLPGAQHLEKLPIGPMPGMKRALAALDDLIYGLIRERRASAKAGGSLGDDLLGMLLEAEDTQAQTLTGQHMSDRQVRDEALTILLAGHETTANALTFALWCTARHTEAQANIRAEVLAACGTSLPTADDYPRLPFTQQVFAESMRLYPPAWVGARTAREPYTMRTGERIPRGAHLIVSQMVAHHDPRWWPDPMRFDPTRFTPEAKATRPKFAYFPFGGGARFCIGEGFAWTEGVLMLATVCQSHTLALPDPTEQAVPITPKFTIRPAAKVEILVTPRRDTDQTDRKDENRIQKPRTSLA